MLYEVRGGVPLKKKLIFFLIFMLRVEKSFCKKVGINGFHSFFNKIQKNNTISHNNIYNLPKIYLGNRLGNHTPTLGLSYPIYMSIL